MNPILSAVLAFAGILLLLAGCCLVFPAWEGVRAKQYERETKRIAGELPARRWSVGELVTRIAGHISDLALGIGRKGAGQ